MSAVLTVGGAEALHFVKVIQFGLLWKQQAVLNHESKSEEVASTRARGIPYQGELCRKARLSKRIRAEKGYPPTSNRAFDKIGRYGRPSRELLSELVTWCEQRQARGSDFEQLSANVRERLGWVQVKHVEDTTAFTVDFVLDGDHSFFTNGILSHNTPFHTGDLYADLGANSEYHLARYAAIKPDGSALWPSRYDVEILAAKKREIGEIRFAREFMADPVADDMSLFPNYLFVGEPTEQFSIKLGMPLEFWQELGVTPYIGVDFAMSSSVQADYTVIWVMGRDGYGNRWIIDIIRRKGLPYQEQLSLINEVGRKYDPALVYLEANQMQRIFGDELIRTTDLPIKKFVTTAAKNTLDKGVPSLRVLLENGKFRIPRGDKHSVEVTNTWKEEMRAFTFTDGKLQSVGTHDDTVMGCYLCEQAIRAGGFSFDFGEHAEGDSMDAILAELTGDSGGDAVVAPTDNGNGSGERAHAPATNPERDILGVGEIVQGVHMGSPRASSFRGY